MILQLYRTPILLATISLLVWKRVEASSSSSSSSSSLMARGGSSLHPSESKRPAWRNDYNNEDDDDDDDDDYEYDEDFVELFGANRPGDADSHNPLLHLPLSISLHDSTPESRRHHAHNTQQQQQHPLSRCCCDTAAQRSVMSYQTAQRLGLLLHVDQRYGAVAVGVGGARCRTVGRLPAGLCQLQLEWEEEDDSPQEEEEEHKDDLGITHCRLRTVVVPSPAIVVLDQTDDNDSMQLLLGLDFLRENHAILDLRRDELRILAHQQPDDETTTTTRQTLPKREYRIPFGTVSTATAESRRSFSKQSWSKQQQQQQRHLSKRGGDLTSNRDKHHVEPPRRFFQRTSRTMMPPPTTSTNYDSSYRHEDVLHSNSLADEEYDEDEFVDMSGV